MLTPTSRVFRFTVAAACLVAVPLAALEGQPGLHDPSTVIVEHGKYYVYATGNGLPMSISEDGWTWRRAGGVMQAMPGGKPGPDVIARGGNNIWAPDIIRVGNKYFLYYAAPGTQPKAAIGLLVGKTLDPQSPDYAWQDVGPVVCAHRGRAVRPAEGAAAQRMHPGAAETRRRVLALSAVGSSTPTLAKFNPDGDRRRWNLRMP